MIDSGILTVEQRAELEALFETTNPADLTRRIVDIQARFIHRAAAETDALKQAVSRAKPHEACDNLSRAS